MNFRLTAIFFAIVVALVMGLLVVVLLEDDKDTAIVQGGLVDSLTKSGVKEKDIDTIELVKTVPNEEKLVFARIAADKWELREPFTAKVDSGVIEGLLRDLFRVKPTKYADLTENLTLHGLDKPSIRVTLKAGADKNAAVNFGNTTIGGSKAVTFVTTTTNPKKPIAVLRSDLSSLFRDGSAKSDGEAWKLAKWLPDYRVRKLLGSDLRDPTSEVQAIKISNPTGKEIALSRGAGSNWTFTNPANFGDADDLGDSAAQSATAPITGIRPLLTAITSLQVQSTEDYLEKPDDLTKYGLNAGEPNMLRIELTSKSGTETLLIGKPVEQGGKPATPAKVYCRLDGDSAVIQIPADRIDALRATLNNPGELRNRDLLPTTQRASIDAIDITVGAGTIKLRKMPLTGEPVPQWVVYGGASGPVQAKNADVELLLTNITKPRAARDVLTAPDNTAFADAEKKATIRVWSKGIEAKPEAKVEPGQLPTEPAIKGTPSELVLGKKDADIVFVRKTVDGKTADLKVPDSLLQLATKSRLEWIDPKLKSFSPATANRLTFNRGAETIDLEKNDATGFWTYAKPDAMKGRTADVEKVSNLIGVLASLFPERVTAEQPTPDDLKKLNLDPAAPRMQVVVGLKDDADKLRMYLFGNDTDDKKGVLLQQAGRAYVVQVSRLAFDKLATENLRDSVVYRLDPAKVKVMKIRGWKGFMGATEPVAYLLEKKDGTWTTSTPNCTPDQAKIEALVAAACTPKAEAFIGLGRVEHGTIVDTNPDGIELTLQADAEPVTLVVGNKLETGLSNATSSATPGETFLFNAKTIRQFTDKPASFQK